MSWLARLALIRFGGDVETCTDGLCVGFEQTVRDVLEVDARLALIRFWGDAERCTVQAGCVSF